jgi:uncharacterized protein with PIN domain
MTSDPSGTGGVVGTSVMAAAMWDEDEVTLAHGLRTLLASQAQPRVSLLQHVEVSIVLGFQGDTPGRR